MKRNHFLQKLVIICILIIGCNNDDKVILQEENQAPSDFTIRVTRITEDSALLEWDLVTDPDNDKVTYTILLGSNEVQSNIESTEFLLEGLISKTKYNGKIVASDRKGGESESNFIFDTAEGSIINEDVSVAWEKSLGGNLDEEGYVIRQTNDGGYVVAGSSESNDGDVGNNKGGKDCWIVKLDVLGNLVWETNLGGSNNDTVHDIQQTSDGGFIVGAFSTSSDNDVGGNNGMRDFWIVKLNINGNLIWETNLGGTSDDILESITLTNDGGYVAAGFTLSYGSGKADAWIIKLDADGDLVWNTSLGGSQNDITASIEQTADQGYIVAGYTTTMENKRDLWVVKLDSSGNLSWEKTFGGSDDEEAVSIQETTDGGYIIAGYSKSLDGDVENNKGSADAWIIKLDVSGNLLWQESLGGSGLDAISEIMQTADGGYIAAGSSNSLDGDIEENHGAIDFWVLKLNTSGDLIWQENLGSAANDYAHSIQQTSDGGYVVAGSWYTNITGSGEGTTGDFNYWVIKLE